MTPCKFGSVGFRSGKANRCKCVQCVEDTRARDRARYPLERDRRIQRERDLYAKDSATVLEKNRQSRLRNIERVNAYDRARYHANAEQNNARRSQHYFENKAATRLRIDLWYQKNKKEIMARNRSREAARAQRIPCWFGELDALIVGEAYDLCDKREKITGGKWEVDHMLPVCGKRVSGLHVWNNIQVIPREINRSKRHREMFTKHGEWMERL